ncbi:MAG: T9SS type A sorting domain-containing protein, partial [Bacteroidota bacterium]
SGILNPVAGSYGVFAGSPFSCTITAPFSVPQQYITDVVTGGTAHTGFKPSPYVHTVTDISSNTTLQVYFGHQILKSANGTDITPVGYPSTFQYFPYSSIVTFNITPANPGSQIYSIELSDADGLNPPQTITVQNGGLGQILTIGNSTTDPLMFPYGAPLQANIRITASASLPTTASNGTHGAVGGAGGAPFGTIMNNYGSSTFYVITPDANYQIGEVLIDGVNKISSDGISLDPNLVISNTPTQSATYTFRNITSAHTIHANFFAHKVHYVITGSGLGGTITPDSPNPLLVNHDVTLYYRVAPMNEDWRIGLLEWTDGVTVWTPPVPIPQNGPMDIEIAHVVTDLTISASFTIAQYGVDIIRNEGGQITPYGTLDPVTGNGHITVNSGTNLTFAIKADAGSYIKDVLVDGVSVGVIGTYTMNQIRKNKTIEAKFARYTYRVYGVAGANGTIFPKDSTVETGTNLTLQIMPNLGYKVATLAVNGASMNPEEEITLLNITSSKTVTATFDATNVYTITATAGQGGTITPSGVVNVNEGMSKQFLIAANTGWNIKDVVVDGTSLGVKTEHTFPNVTANHTIDATFEQIPVPQVECTLSASTIVSGASFDYTIKVKDQNTGLPYNVPLNIPVTITTAGTGVLSGVTTGQLTAGTSEVTINGVVYTKADGELDVVFTATAMGYTGCTQTATIMAAEPARQESAISFPTFNSDRATVDWVSGDGAKKLVVCKPQDAILDTEIPADGLNYTANAVYASGQQLGSNGCYAVYNGTGNSVEVTGLTINTTYYFRVFGYNGDGATANYITGTSTDNPNSVLVTSVEGDNVPTGSFEISNIAPNPVVNELRFDLNLIKGMPVTIELMDVTGRKVMTQSKSFEVGKNKVSFNVENLPAGAYILQVSSGNDSAIRTLTIVR